MIHPTALRSRRIPAVVALVVAASLLAGCASDEESYCEVLAEEQKTLNDLAEQAADAETDVLTPTLDSFERLRDAAPDELADEWDTVVFAYQALADAVAASGVDPAGYRPGGKPEGLSSAEARRLAAVASKLRSTRVAEAGSGIEDHANEVCGVDFGA
jgi:hypothetical protein